MISNRILNGSTRDLNVGKSTSIFSKKRNLRGNFHPAVQHLEERTLLSGMASADITVTTVHNTPVSVSAYYSHVGDAPVTLEILSNVSHGTLSAFSGGGYYSYTPDPNFVGTDNFTFKASDESSTANGSVTIQVTNQAPVAYGTTQILDHDQTYSDSLYVFDGDHDNLTYSQVTAPAHGTLILYSSGYYAYTPDPQYVGNDSFSFKGNDGITDSNVATENFIIVNHAPVADAASFSTPHDQSISTALFASDQEGDVLTYTVVSDVSHGSLSLSPAGFLIYTPAAHYIGADSFTFKTNDGIADSNTATVTINVQPVPVTVSASGETTWTYFNESRLGQVFSGNNTASLSLSAVSLDGQNFEGPPTYSASHDERLGNTEEIVKAGTPVAFQQTVNGESIAGYRAVYDVKWTISKAFFVSLFLNIPDTVDDFFGNYLNYTTESTITITILANGTTTTEFSNQQNNPYYSPNNSRSY